jgi:hypothetical protein
VVETFKLECETDTFVLELFEHRGEIGHSGIVLEVLWVGRSEVSFYELLAGVLERSGRSTEPLDSGYNGV